MRRAVLFLVFLVACSGGDTVHVTGSVEFSAQVTLGVCAISATGTTVTVRDGEGTVIGTAQTGTRESPSMGPDFGIPGTRFCKAKAPFEMDLPRTDFYEVQLGKVEPLAPLSYEELKARGFRLDLTMT